MRAVLPVAALWVGKLIIDEVVCLSALPSPPDTLLGWWSSGAGRLLAASVLTELGLFSPAERRNCIENSGYAFG